MFFRFKPLPKAVASAGGGVGTQLPPGSEMQLPPGSKSQKDDNNSALRMSTPGTEAEGCASAEYRPKHAKASGEGTSDGQHKRPPPSGNWACTFHSAVHSGPHHEDQNYNFHADGRMTGRISNSFCEFEIKGSWKEDGTFSYIQVGGDLVKVDGKANGERVEGSFRSIRDSGRFTSVLVCAKAEKKQPKFVSRSSVKGILKTARTKTVNRKKAQRVSFPIPFVFESV